MEKRILTEIIFFLRPHITWNKFVGILMITTAITAYIVGTLIACGFALGALLATGLAMVLGYLQYN